MDPTNRQNLHWLIDYEVRYLFFIHLQWLFVSLVDKIKASVTNIQIFSCPETIYLKCEDALMEIETEIEIQCVFFT